MVDNAQTTEFLRCVFFVCYSPVHTGEAFKEVHLFFISQAQHFVV